MGKRVEGTGLVFGLRGIAGNQGALEHLLVDFDVRLRAFFVRESVARVLHDTGDLRIPEIFGEAVESHRLIDGPREGVGIVVVENETVAGILGDIEMPDRIVEPARIVDDRQGAVEGADHLGETARFEAGWHEDEIRSGVTDSGERFVEVGDGHPILNAMERDDVAENALILAIGDNDDLQFAVPVAADDSVQDIGKKGAAFLDGIESGGPEEDGGIVVLHQAEFSLQMSFCSEFSLHLVFGIVLQGEGGIRRRVVAFVGGIEDADGAARIAFGAHFRTNGGRNPIVATIGDFIQEFRGDGIDEVCGEDAGCEKIDGDIVVSGVPVIVGRLVVVEVAPEFGGIDTDVLDPFQRDVLGVDIVDGEEGRNSAAAGDSGNQPRHPVVAVNEIRLDGAHDIVDDLALEGEGDFRVFAIVVRVDGFAIVEDTVFREMDTRFRESGAQVQLQFAFDQILGVHVKHLPVIRKSDMDIGALVKKGADEGCGDIGKSTGLGNHMVCPVTHSRGEIGNLRCNNQDTRISFSRHGND